MEQANVQFIGVLHGDIQSREDAPKNFDESERVGTLEIYPQFQDGIDGIAPGQTIVVRQGDTLGKLSSKVYGRSNERLLGIIQENNPDIRNPNFILPGQKLIFPPLPETQQ